MQLACLFTAVAPLGAQRAVTLEDAVATALRRNVDVRSAQVRVDSTRAEERIARAFSNPTFNVAPQNPYQYSVAAPLDVGPQRWHRVGAASAASSASVSDARDTERLVRFAVRQAFADVLLAESLRDVARDARDVVRDLLAADSARVRAGDAPERILGRSELELARAEAALAQAEAGVRGARLALQQQMGVEHPDPSLRVEGSLTLRPAQVPDSAAVAAYLSRRPDVEGARQRIEAARAGRAVASAQRLPVPALSLVQQREEPFPNGQHYALGVSASVPVWNWFTGDVARADASVTLAQLAEERTLLGARVEAVGAIDQLHAATVLAERYDGGLLAKARDALETARYAWRAGAISYVELLDAVRTWAATRAEADTARHDYWISVWALDRALGAEVTQP
ncbi:MAG: TolC family protein [Gemmatimonadetes bacterium]|nr:TolC family protein [Gemmatimonadota bacterium]